MAYDDSPGRKIGKTLIGYRKKAGYSSARDAARRLHKLWGVALSTASEYVSGIESGHVFNRCGRYMLRDAEKRVSDYVALVGVPGEKAERLFDDIREISPDFVQVQSMASLELKYSDPRFRELVARYRRDTVVPEVGAKSRAEESFIGGLETAIMKVFPVPEPEEILDSRIDYAAIEEMENKAGYKGLTKRIQAAFNKARIRTYKDIAKHSDAHNRELALTGVGKKCQDLLFSYMHSRGMEMWGGFKPTEIGIYLKVAQEESKREAVLNSTIRESSLPERAKNVLSGIGVMTLRDLAGTKEGDVLAARNCGPLTLKKIKRLLKEKGLSFAG